MQNERANVVNLNHINRDRGYRFRDRDPDMEWICDAITRSGLSINDLLERVLDVSHNSVHLSYGTINNWMSGKTKRPQNYTLGWVALALGYKRRWVAERKPPKDF